MTTPHVAASWTVPAPPLTEEPWSEIIDRLWVGGHDYSSDGHVMVAFPRDLFGVVVDLYSREDERFNPAPGTEHVRFALRDARPTPAEILRFAEAALIVADRHRAGEKVLVRCQAGLNRSSFVAGLAMVELGHTGQEALQLLRSRRSEWALCNEQFATFLTSENAPTVLETERSRRRT